MIRSSMVSLLAATALSSAAAAADLPANISSALADASRPAKDVERDAARKPGELLALAGVKPGDTVVDFSMGGGYFTRILATAVGPEGKVYAYQPAEFIAYDKSYGEALKTVSGAYANVTPLDASLAGLDLPDGVDMVMTVQNYHDLHLKAFPADTAAKVNAEIFATLKPGGLFLVVDHEAADGAPMEVADSLHRIDKAKLRKEIEAAGFVFEGESQLLDNPSDPHTASVFDPAIRGKTDQFTMSFRKPA